MSIVKSIALMMPGRTSSINLHRAAINVYDFLEAIRQRFFRHVGAASPLVANSVNAIATAGFNLKNFATFRASLFHRENPKHADVT